MKHGDIPSWTGRMVRPVLFEIFPHGSAGSPPRRNIQSPAGCKRMAIPIKFLRDLFAAVLAACLCATAVSAASLHGVDIYHGSNVLSFAALKTSGYADFVWIKSSEGEHTKDSQFASYSAGAQAAGIPWGPYHFLHMYSVASAVRQADFFYDQIKGRSFTVTPAVDVESYDGQEYAKDIRAIVRAFINEFYKRAGYKPVIYTYVAYANDIFDTSFTDCKLWIADYRGYHGSVPGWGTKYAAWQYSGGTARLAGVDNPVDLNLADSTIFLKAPIVQPPKPVFPGVSFFGWGRTNNYILTLDKALIKAGYSRYYKYGAAGASRTWGNGTQRACAAFQRAQGWFGSGADGIPGPLTWIRLQKFM